MSLFAMVAAQVLNICTLATVDRAATPTRACLTCHDGSVGSGIAIHERESHPADVDYVRAWRETGRFKAVAVGSNLVFPNGLLTCTTCHDATAGTSRAEHWLAQSNDRSSLCFACHAL